MKIGVFPLNLTHAMHISRKKSTRSRRLQTKSSQFPICVKFRSLKKMMRTNLVFE
jgi:hypothetical protein